ncbi:hypothetical protein DTO013E5_7375 [Penicillium roqueforti]|uniref:N-acetylglucosamine-induced protein 1 n=1 Tax=Penicillium roqueforti (strain FM164) TaxID=1365484 RepID=W6QVC3_PENRF|nr:uncharacterized protein LCP9604111_5130 [Penicillium roqueforti]CDM33512.1 Protein of unknown function DUF3605 [Penicillium roqueforti FM164]KAF9248891.1 hypothetical protein LCP9604111_5130 [Penicillium roqueforti]KAI1831769.1 hypothetical protein CBS147337_7579 [Penicillium roqueforti]KAI2681552.1 hypothetical protein CBS147355_2762 [Penicillium roqueforti]KAI2688940.1 hypothetical protein LCP963914a_2029 [Penicillium roqueforti]
MLHSRRPSMPAPIGTLDEKSTDTDEAALHFHDHSQASGSLPYWLVNLPRSQWTAECPSFLRDQSPKNIKCLSIPDCRYTRQDWEEVKEIIGTNRIDRFQRVPSELRKYLEYMAHIKAEYTSVMRFVVKERLGWGDNWEEIKPRGGPFEYEEDIRIIYNDWPYGVAKDIIHLVVWTKFELEDDPTTDDLMASTRAAIESYVQDTFCSRVPPEQVVWFKNWKSLKSVPGIEHFHVMLHRPDMAFVREITRGDVPLIERL